jgi:hypothetical protein
MITDRSQAYGRIMRTLRQCCASTGGGDEIARLRDACATLVSSPAPSAGDRHAMTAAIIALADLVARGSVSSELAAAIVHDIGACAAPGPAGSRP